MLLRLLVLVFALNAFASPVIASLACDMMNDADMSAMSHDMSTHTTSDHKMVDVDKQCGMDNDHSCDSLGCITSCATSFSFVAFDKVKAPIFELSRDHSKDNLLSLYEIFHPIKTPPPLV